MRITLSAIKADIGSIGGHLAPSETLIDTVRQSVHERRKADYVVVPIARFRSHRSSRALSARSCRLVPNALHS